MSQRHRRVATVSVAALAAASSLIAGVAPAAADNPPQHAAITIRSNADFTACGCVTGGSGTASSPYVIGPWAIKTPSAGGWAVKVDNGAGTVTAYFTITGITAQYADTNASDPVIWVAAIPRQTTISNISSNGAATGVELTGDQFVTLSGLSLDKMNGDGVSISGSSHVTIDNSKMKDLGSVFGLADGVHAVDSSYVKIGTSASCPNNQPCVDVTYDDGFGVYFQNVNNSVINETTASSNDTGGFVLDGTGTYNDTIENSVSSGTGPICISGTTTTGYHTDMQGGLHLADGAYNNTITGDTFSANTGLSVASGGNGFFFNACTNNNDPFSPPTPPMGSGNTFTNVCYTNTNISNPPLGPSKCSGT